MSLTFFEVYKQGLSLLKNTHIETPELDAEWLFLYAFKCSKPHFLTHFKTIAQLKETRQYLRLIQERSTGKPLAYILKQWDFRKHTYKVAPGVLIPRPETELLVDTALTLIKKNNWTTNLTIIELGFGSGIISIELALELPYSKVYSWDKAKTPYRIATQNARTLNAPNIHWISKDFFKDTQTWVPLLAKQPLLFVANPPYIPDKDIQDLDETVRKFEPHIALKGGKEGMKLYTQLITLLLPYKVPMIFEIGIHQESLFRTLLHKFKLNESQFSFVSDFNTIPRVITILP